jgi:hypothetical protein
MAGYAFKKEQIMRFKHFHTLAIASEAHARENYPGMFRLGSYLQLSHYAIQSAVITQPKRSLIAYSCGLQFMRAQH